MVLPDYRVSGLDFGWITVLPVYQVFVATVMCYAHCGRDRQELSALRRNRDRQRVVVDLQVYMYALGVRVCHTSCRVYVSLRSCFGVGHMLGDTIAV